MKEKEEILQKKNVRGVFESTDGEKLIVCVTEKLPEGSLAEEDIVPKSVESSEGRFDTDVIESGEIGVLGLDSRVQNQKDRKGKERPATAGFSCGHPDITAGTLGTPLLEADNYNGYVFLTNSHVAAPEQKDNIGDNVLQPGPADGGTNSDTIGTVIASSDIDPNSKNKTDIAICSVEENDLVKERTFQLASVNDLTTEVLKDEKYYKSGRTTGVTDGTLVGTNGEVKVNGFVEGEAVTFTDVDLFSPILEGGDSGSLIGYENDGKFYGSHIAFAGSPYQSIAIPISNVFEEFGSLYVIDSNGEREGEEKGPSDDGLTFLEKVKRWVLGFL